MEGGGLLGIEVSGDAEQWRAGREGAHVWVASGHVDGAGLQLDDLRPVQALDGEGPPFDRLLALLAATQGVAGLSGPFSLPRGQAASALLLWSDAARLRKGARPFGQARDLLAQYGMGDGESPWRACETVWRERGLEVPSTLAAGVQGAASLALATMTLLQRHDGPVWPLRAGGDGAILVEASPAGQLVQWGLEGAAHVGAKAGAAARRQAILTSLTGERGLVLSEDHGAAAGHNGHALNAILCLWAARVMAEGRHPRRLPMAARSEGWIVVDETTPADASAPLIEAATEHAVQSLFDRLYEAMRKPGGAA